MEKLLSESFIFQMKFELSQNQHKGCWLKWHPSEREILSEIEHHLEKLKLALIAKNKSNIREFSADLANLSEKVFIEFGL